MKGLPNINVEMTAMDRALITNALVYFVQLVNQQNAWDRAFFKPQDIQVLIYKMQGVPTETAQQMMAGLMSQAETKRIMANVANGSFDPDKKMH